MNRRRFVGSLGAIGLAAGVAGGWKFWPEQGLANPCLAGLPDAVANHPLMQRVWADLDATQVWDCHVHLVGGGDDGNGTWYSPDLDSLAHPMLYVQKRFYTNASCVDAAPGRLDAGYVARLRSLVAGMRPGFKAMLFAFDWFHDEKGRPDPARSVFHIPNAYAARIARTYPGDFEWVASIHPYRQDCVEALHWALANGARAIKWLPSAMGIDPSSPRCDRLYEAMAAADLPLISHAGRELAVAGGSQDLGNPLRLRRALDHGVRVVIAHCASDGDDQDLDAGPRGPRIRSHDLFARMMDDPRHAGRLYGDVSALTQLNRAWALESVLRRRDWHPRLLNGSDYPLPGVMPLFSLRNLARVDLIDQAAVPWLQAVRKHNPLLFDFALKRLLRSRQGGLPARVFETRRFFERTPA